MGMICETVDENGRHCSGTVTVFIDEKPRCAECAVKAYEAYLQWKAGRRNPDMSQRVSEAHGEAPPGMTFNCTASG